MNSSNCSIVSHIHTHTHTHTILVFQLWKIMSSSSICTWHFSEENIKQTILSKNQKIFVTLCSHSALTWFFLITWITFSPCLNCCLKLRDYLIPRHQQGFQALRLSTRKHQAMESDPTQERRPFRHNLRTWPSTTYKFNQTVQIRKWKYRQTRFL